MPYLTKRLRFCIIQPYTGIQRARCVCVCVCDGGCDLQRRGVLVGLAMRPRVVGQNIEVGVLEMVEQQVIDRARVEAGKEMNRHICGIYLTEEDGEIGPAQRRIAQRLHCNRMDGHEIGYERERVLRHGII